MGYSTDFEGMFKLDRELDDETYDLLYGLSHTRRMKRKGLSCKYGIDGEFYFDSNDFKNFGCSVDEYYDEYYIVDRNIPPATQPGLWLQWIPTEDRKSIVWDGCEKFYNYIEWIHYIINKILIPKKYILNGTVKWSGKNSTDKGTIIINDNMVDVINFHV